MIVILVRDRPSFSQGFPLCFSTTPRLLLRPSGFGNLRDVIRAQACISRSLTFNEDSKSRCCRELYRHDFRYFSDSAATDFQTTSMLPSAIADVGRSAAVADDLRISQLQSENPRLSRDMKHGRIAFDSPFERRIRPDHHCSMYGQEIERRTAWRPQLGCAALKCEMRLCDERRSTRIKPTKPVHELPSTSPLAHHHPLIACHPYVSGPFLSKRGAELSTPRTESFQGTST